MNKWEIESKITSNFDGILTQGQQEVLDYIEQLQQKIKHLEEKEELHLNRIDELIDEIVKLKTNRKKAIKLLKRGTAFCENDSYGGYEVCKIAIKRESEAIKILKGDSNE